MTCGGIIILAERAQGASGKHFNQAQLDATWENTTMLLRLIARENQRAQGYLGQLLQLKEQASTACFRGSNSCELMKSSNCPDIPRTATSNSSEPTRTASRRLSVSLEATHGVDLSRTYAPSTDDQAVQGELMTLLFQDNWDWSLDSGMPIYGGVGFGDEFTFPLSSWST